MQNKRFHTILLKSAKWFPSVPVRNAKFPIICSPAMPVTSSPKTVTRENRKWHLPKIISPCRRAELVQQRILDYERIQARTKLAETEKRLSGILYERGVDSKGFALIRSKGDKALFRIDTALLKRKLGAPESRPLADFLPTISIKAKDFAAEMTSVNVQQKDLYGQQEIGKEHVDNNAAVRDMLLQRGIVPEQLPPGEDVKKVERRLKSEEKRLTGKAKKK